MTYYDIEPLQGHTSNQKPLLKIDITRLHMTLAACGTFNTKHINTAIAENWMENNAMEMIQLQYTLAVKTN